MVSKALIVSLVALLCVQSIAASAVAPLPWMRDRLSQEESLAHFNKQIDNYVQGHEIVEYGFVGCISALKSAYDLAVSGISLLREFQAIKSNLAAETKKCNLIENDTEKKTCMDKAQGDAAAATDSAKAEMWSLLTKAAVVAYSLTQCLSIV